jgi:predicted nucleic acid-binding Zn ribbon protein
MRPPARTHYDGRGCGIRRERQQSVAIGSPAPHRPPADDPPIDPRAVERGLARARAKRRARLEHEREQKRARFRFWFLLLALIFLVAFLSLSIWEKIGDVFGL